MTSFPLELEMSLWCTWSVSYFINAEFALEATAITVVKWHLHGVFYVANFMTSHFILDIQPHHWQKKKERLECLKLQWKKKKKINSRGSQIFGRPERFELKEKQNTNPLTPNFWHAYWQDPLPYSTAVEQTFSSPENKTVFHPSRTILTSQHEANQKKLTQTQLNAKMLYLIFPELTEQWTIMCVPEHGISLKNIYRKYVQEEKKYMPCTSLFPFQNKPWDDALLVKVTRGKRLHNRINTSDVYENETLNDQL